MLDESCRGQSNRVRFPSATLTASFANSDIRQRVETIFSEANRTEKIVVPDDDRS